MSFNYTIGSKSSIAEWTDLFTGGFCVHLEDIVLANFDRSFAWVDSGVFTMYVPYGVAIKDTKGNIQQQGIYQDYCQNSLKDTDDLRTLTICDAPGGMARIFNAGTVKAYECLSSTLLKNSVADIASPLFQ